MNKYRRVFPSSPLFSFIVCSCWITLVLVAANFAPHIKVLVLVDANLVGSLFYCLFQMRMLLTK